MAPVIVTRPNKSPFAGGWHICKIQKTPTTRPDGPFVVVGVFIFQTALCGPLQPPFLVDTRAGALVFAARGVEMPGEDEADAARELITILRIDDILPV